MKWFSVLFITMLIFIGSKNAFAHPHVFIDTNIAIDFDDSGIGYLDVTFSFDNMFSADFISQFDTDQNNKIDEQENKTIQEKAFSNLENYNYFVHVIVSGQKLEFKEVYYFQAQIKNNIVVYSFKLKPNIPIEKESATIKIAPYDQSYYIDVALNKKDLKFENTEDYSFSYEIIEDKSQAYYYDQIYPDCLVLVVNRK